MSHLTIYVSIPSEKLKGDTSVTHIDSLTRSVLRKYVEATARMDMAKIDWYCIGGRWAGTFAADTSSVSAYRNDENIFAYDFNDRYNAVCNNGNKGPYIAGEEEFIPVNGALYKDIKWDAFGKLIEYSRYKYFLLVVNKDERLGGVPDELEIVNGDLYIRNDEHTLLLKSGEAFEEYIKRTGKKFDRVFVPPDAFIDREGKWHDLQQMLYSENEDDIKIIDKYLCENVDMTEAMAKMFEKKLNAFIDNFPADDYLLVVDGHTFP